MLAEQPWMISLMLAALVVAFVMVWLQSGKKFAAVAALVSALLIPLSWVVAERWVTDREQIELLIYQTADAVERNDVDTAVSVIGDPQTEAMARAELPRYRFTMADVHQIRSIDLIDGTYPPQAEVDMSVKADVSTRGGSIQDLRVLRRLVLQLEKRDDRWVVLQYQHFPIVGGPDADSSLFANPGSP